MHVVVFAQAKRGVVCPALMGGWDWLYDRRTDQVPLNEVERIAI